MVHLRLAFTAVLMCLTFITHAQKAVVKTDLLTDVTLTPNIGVEVGIAPKWTVELRGQLNAWSVNNHDWRHWMVQPEVRYWFCRRFAGHFVGMHALGGKYNFGNIKNNINFLGSDLSKLTDYRYQGWAVGAGVAYGYTWILNRRWSFEATIGFGWIYTRFDTFECRDCGKRIDRNRPHNYVGPTKAALNIIYAF